jgi:ribosomal protein L1
VKSLTDKKPAAIKGKYFMDAYLKSSMGPRWKLKIEWIDPKHKFYIMDMR